MQWPKHTWEFANAGTETVLETENISQIIIWLSSEYLIGILTLSAAAVDDGCNHLKDEQSAARPKEEREWDGEGMDQVSQREHRPKKMSAFKV